MRKKKIIILFYCIKKSKIIIYQQISKSYFIFIFIDIEIISIIY